MKTICPMIPVVIALLCAVARSPAADTKPYVNGRFQGRIAYSADGNHNDRDDWIASPVALAIFAEAGLRERLVHFHYNCILPLTDPEWEKIHAESVLGAAAHYGFDKSRFFDCRQNLDGAIADLSRAINESTANNPLYFIVAGPMEVPFRAIEKSQPSKRQFVYCISHSRWNDGYASNYKFTFTKRSVIEQGVHWTQIRDQNERLSLSRYGQPAKPEEFAPFFWMRDSRDAKVRFLWERMLVSTRPDPSDAGMAWFLVTGDEECDPAKLRRLLEERQSPTIEVERARVRLEAENFRHLDGCAVDERKDRGTSHQLSVRLNDGVKVARLNTRFDEPFVRATGRYDVEVRYFAEKNARGQFALFVNGAARGAPWQSAGATGGWTTQRIEDVAIHIGDEVRVDVEGTSGRVDFVQLNLRKAKTGE